MPLDAPTLMVTAVLVTAITGLLFLLSWSQTRAETALAWWGASHLVGAFGASLLSARGLISDLLSIGVANASLMLAYGLMWNGVRAFERKPLWVGLSFLGAAVWSLACFVPAFYASIEARVVLAAGTAGAYAAAATFELWRGRNEALVSRYPALTIMAAHALFCASRVPLAILVPSVPGVDPFKSFWAPILALEAVLHTVTRAFIFMALTKERAEHKQRLAAMTDPLTGVANRRAFTGQAKATMASMSGPASLLLFDIDHFKRINDTYGHGVGDLVLIAFSRIAGDELPPQAAFGRLGGEEFAAVLPSAFAGEVTVIANRIRSSFADTLAEGVPGLSVSVSIGIAASSAGDDLSALLARADAALYRAKRLGRDRVEWARPALLPPASMAA